MRISDWSSDVCSSDLFPIYAAGKQAEFFAGLEQPQQYGEDDDPEHGHAQEAACRRPSNEQGRSDQDKRQHVPETGHRLIAIHRLPPRSEEHTSELQSLMRISYAVFCLKKKKQAQ